MDYTRMMNSLLTGKVGPRTDLDKTWSNKEGIYAIWGNGTLKKKLLPKEIEIHASKQNRGRVILGMRKAIKRSIKRKDADGNKLFCFYVGKTAHLKKRMTIQRFGKVWRLLDLKNSIELKAMLQISFCRMKDWDDRFFAEGFAIAKLLPVMNAQPER